MKKNKLGLFLKKIRMEKKMSLREFSGYLDISHTYLDKLEKGIDIRTGKDITPTIETLKKIAAGSGIPLKDFMRECGYLEEERSLLFSGPSGGSEVDIFERISDLKIDITSARVVLCRNRTLNDEEIELTQRFLEGMLKMFLEKEDTH